MTTKKEEIEEVKCKGKVWVSEKSCITPNRIKDYLQGCELYTVIEKDKSGNFSYLGPDSNDKLPVNYTNGVKYICNGRSYYLFWKTDNSASIPSGISVGKEQDGMVYLISEDFSKDLYYISFNVMPKSMLSNKMSGYSEGYSHGIDFSPLRRSNICNKISYRDETCISIAANGVMAFDELLREFFDA